MTIKIFYWERKVIFSDEGMDGRKRDKKSKQRKPSRVRLALYIAMNPHIT